MKKSILYLGNDQGLLEGLQMSSSLYLKNVEINDFGFLPGLLIEKVRHYLPHLVIVDSQNAGYLADEIRSLKRLADHKATLFVAICSDQRDAEEKSYLLTAGVSLLYVQGTEIQTFMIDCFFIAFGLKKKINMFAQAENLKVKLMTGFLSSIVCLSETSLMIESDISFDEKLPLDFANLADVEQSEFYIERRDDFSVVAPFFHTYHTVFPFPGPWDVVTSNSIQPETIETWIDLHKEHFDPRNKCLALFTNNSDFITDLLQRKPQPFWYDIHQDNETELDQIIFKKYAAIFYEIDDDGPHDLNHLSLLITTIRKNCDENIMLVIFNTPSDTDALRKTFDYTSMIGTMEKMKGELFSLLQSKLSLKNKSIASDSNYLRSDDPARIVHLINQLTLTNITEHDVNFLSPFQIPVFSVLVFHLPLPFYVTIVPTDFPIIADSVLFKYSGIIHGIGEEGLTKLRKLVNQIIYSPVQELTEEIVKVMLKQDYLIKVPVKESIVSDRPTSEELVVSESLDHKRRFKLNRIYKTKSKL